MLELRLTTSEAEAAIKELAEALGDLTMPTDDQERFGVTTYQERAEQLRAERNALAEALREIQDYAANSKVGSRSRMERMARAALDAYHNAAHDRLHDSLPPPTEDAALDKLGVNNPDEVERRAALRDLFADDALNKLGENE